MQRKITVKSSGYKNDEIDLRDLSITNNELEEVFLEIKKAYPEVRSIFLAKNQIDDEGVKLIVPSLDKLKHLQFIDLQFNKISSEGAEILFTLKRSHPDLRIALHGNKITDEAEMYAIENQYNKNNRI